MTFEHLAVRQQALDLLKTIYDPEIPVNVWDLGLIYGIDYNPKSRNVIIIMTLTSPNCPAIDILPQQIQETIETLAGVDTVEIDLVWEPAWSKSMMSEEARMELGMWP